MFVHSLVRNRLTGTLVKKLVHLFFNSKNEDDETFQLLREHRGALGGRQGRGHCGGGERLRVLVGGADGLCLLIKAHSCEITPLVVANQCLLR